MEKVDIIKEICKNQQFYGIPCYYEDAVFESIDGNLSKMNENQVKEYIEQIRSLNKEKNYDLPCFDNEDFIVNIINNIDIDEIEKYMLNTKEYIMHHECDKNYVLLFRRAIPSDEPITENFWTTNFNEVFRGLSMEISGDQRIHSVINIATLDSLERHGVVVTDRGVTDGEVAIDPNKNFNSFLFRYKPWIENFELIDNYAKLFTVR